MEAEAGLFGQLKALRKQGQLEQALATMRTALRATAVSPEDMEHAGRLLRKLRPERDRDLKVLVLGQCTTAWLANVLEAEAFGRGLDLSVTQGEFDNVLQDLTAYDRSHAAFDAVILLPWNQRLLRPHDGSSSSRVDDELNFWRDVWRVAQDRGHQRIVQVGYDWIVPGSLGQHLGGLPGGDVALVRTLNDALRHALPRNGYFVDLEQLSGTLGRAQFYEPRQYHWTKQPFSSAGLAALARQLIAGIRASTTGPKKLLVLDLDNTLWGGVVGELGPNGIRLGEGPDGEAYSAFQSHLKALSNRGVLLAVASKNNASDAREPFEKNPDMVLSMNDLAAFAACWDPKAMMLRSIATKVGLGLDSFVFFDDNPAEREHIRQALPQVEVVEVPTEPAEYIRALSNGCWFESLALTAEDQMRTRQYAVARERDESQGSFGSVDDYLASLDMRALVKPLDDADLPRVVQLLGKTNQFNLTTRRHTEEQVRRMMSTPKSICFTVRMRDRFGDHGLVACVLAVPQGPRDETGLVIDTWLMSCRVIGRTLEQLTLRCLAENATALGHRRLLGEFVATAKNQLVADLYATLGFEALSELSGDIRRYQIALPLATPPTTRVALEEM